MGFSVWLLFEEFLNSHLTGKKQNGMMVRKQHPKDGGLFLFCGWGDVTMAIFELEHLTSWRVLLTLIPSPSLEITS